MRQIVEEHCDKLSGAPNFHKERPQGLSGLRACLALLNFCVWLNDGRGSSRLAFADLADGNLKTHTKHCRMRYPEDTSSARGTMRPT